MIRLEDITTGLALTGLEPAAIGSVVAVVPIGEGAVQIIYKIPDGTLKDRLLNRADEQYISIATTERYTGVTTRALQETLRKAHPRG